MAKTINLNGLTFELSEVPNALRIAYDSRMQQVDMLEAFAKLGRLEQQDKFYADDPGLSRISRDIDEIQEEIEIMLAKPRAERDVPTLKKLEADYKELMEEYEANRDSYFETEERAKLHQAKKFMAHMDLFNLFLDLLWFTQCVVDLDEVTDLLSAQTQVAAWLKVKDEDKAFLAWKAGVDQEDFPIVRELIARMGKSHYIAPNRATRRKQGQDSSQTQKSATRNSGKSSKAISAPADSTTAMP